MKKTKEDIVLGTIKYICIAALLIVVLFPIIWLVAGSFKLEKEILSADKPSQDNYTTIVLNYHGKGEKE